eukprot:TRINITY_DN13114_c0_g1_i1.p1 TRINITY_DN13114_c0_g1~~TRINITY_DN13114_c0_g1_i1.p1  ORF type:complete len:1009 (+),score=218.23 TRINITY_DN13114_c0_g1_i1:39-3065(+)
MYCPYGSCRNDFGVVLIPIDVKMNIDVVFDKAIVTLEQVFKNEDDRYMTGTYEVMIPENSQVISFHFEHEGEIKDTTLIDNEESDDFDLYNEDLKDRSDLTLPLIFTAELENISKDSRFDVKVTYVCPLEVRNDIVFLNIPSDTNVFKYEKLDQCNIKIEMPFEISDIECELHNLSILSLEGNKASISLLFSPDEADADINVAIMNTQYNKVGAMVGKHEGFEDVVMLTYFPEVTNDDLNTEFIFLVDRSGSMDQHDNIFKVKTILRNMLPLIQDTNTFNIVGFGQSIEACFEYSSTPTPEALADAEAYIEEMHGDMGTTELLEAIRCVYEEEIVENSVRHVLLFTDGEIEMVDDIISYVKEQSNENTRLHTFGFSNEGKWLINALGALSPGLALFVDDEFLEEGFTQASFQEINQQWSQDIQLDFGDIFTFASPQVQPFLSEGECAVFCGILNPQRTSDVFTFTSKSGEKISEATFNINDITYTNDNGLLHKVVGLSIVNDMTILKEDLDEIATVSRKLEVPSCVMELSAPSMELYTRPTYAFAYTKPATVKTFSSGSIWSSYAFLTRSHLDELLEQGEYTLEQILCEDDLISQCESNNENLIRYLTRPYVCKKLLAHVVDTEDNGRFSIVSTDVLSLNFWRGFKSVLLTESNLNTLIDPITSDDADLVHRICRVLSSMLRLSTTDVVEVLKAKEDFIQSITAYLTYPFIVDVFNSLVSDYNEKTIEWLLQQNIISTCIENLNPGIDQTTRDNITDLLETVLSASKLYDSTARLVEPKCILDVVSSMFDESGEISESYYNSLCVLILLINTIIEGPNTDVIAGYIRDVLPKFLGLLQKKEYRSASFGQMRVCGTNTIKTVQFITTLINAKVEQIDECLIEMDILSHCLDLFFECYTNNFLHQVVLDQYQTLMRRESCSLKVHTLRERAALDKIILGYEESKGEKRNSIAYTGHLILIAQEIREGYADPEVEKLCKEHEKWGVFIDEVIEAERKRQGPYLCGKPRIYF